MHRPIDRDLRASSQSQGATGCLSQPASYVVARDDDRCETPYSLEEGVNVPMPCVKDYVVLPIAMERLHPLVLSWNRNGIPRCAVLCARLIPLSLLCVMGLKGERSPTHPHQLVLAFRNMQHEVSIHGSLDHAFTAPCSHESSASHICGVHSAGQPTSRHQ